MLDTLKQNLKKFPAGFYVMMVGFIGIIAVISLRQNHEKKRSRWGCLFKTGFFSCRIGENFCNDPYFGGEATCCFDKKSMTCTSCKTQARCNDPYLCFDKYVRP